MPSTRRLPVVLVSGIAVLGTHVLPTEAATATGAVVFVVVGAALASI